MIQTRPEDGALRSQVRVWGAVAMIAVGLLWLVDQLAPAADVAEHMSRWWPAALILIGLGGVVRLLLAQNALRGPLLITLGGTLLLCFTLDPLPPAVESYFWPTILILAGIGLLIRLSITDRESDDAREVMRLVTVGESRRIKWPAGPLSLATVNAVASGCVIDLSNVEPLDSMARLDITAIGSGVDLIVPATWSVELNAHHIMGRCRNATRMENQENARYTFHVEGLAILAGIVIRNSS